MKIIGTSLSKIDSKNKYQIRRHYKTFTFFFKEWKNSDFKGLLAEKMLTKVFERREVREVLDGAVLL